MDLGVTAAVLLIHSGGFTARQWRKLAEALAPRHRVIAPDLIGYAPPGSWPVGAPFHFRQDVALLESLVAEPVHVVGHSYGGLLSLQLALARPDRVRSIAVYEPVAFSVLDPAGDAEAVASLRGFPPYAPDAAGVDDAWLERFVDWWNGAGTWAALPTDTKQGFRQVGWKVSEEVRSLVDDMTDRATYARIEAPTLLLGGSRSPLAARRVLDILAATLPHAHLHRFDGLGHMAPITHATTVNAAIVGHITAFS
jgi:pimeloyl-ACP methyl ester carboxylesterase